MTRTRFVVAATASATAIALAIACREPTSTTTTGVRGARAGFDQPGAHRQYGTPVKVGNGTVRTYVVLDQKNGGAPLEVGVAMSESALDGLPAPAASGDMMANMHMNLLDMPAQNPTQYKFVQFDWNPIGHEPAGVYDQPHFDFHFYTVSREVRASILPSDPQYAAKAASYPAAEFRAPFYLDAATAAGARGDDSADGTPLARRAQPRAAEPDGPSGGVQAVHQDLHLRLVGRPVHLRRADDHPRLHHGEARRDRSGGERRDHPRLDRRPLLAGRLLPERLPHHVGRPGQGVSDRADAAELEGVSSSRA
jgi:hypothetical protein